MWFRKTEIKELIEEFHSYTIVRNRSGNEYEEYMTQYTEFSKAKTYAEFQKSLNENWHNFLWKLNTESQRLRAEVSLRQFEKYARLRNMKEGAKKYNSEAVKMVVHLRKKRVSGRKRTFREIGEMMDKDVHTIYRWYQYAMRDKVIK